MALVFNRWNKQPVTERLLPMLEQWFNSERGNKLLTSQKLLIDEALSRCFGYHLLQLSVDSRIKLFDECRVQRKYCCHPFAGGVNVNCNFEQLPFASESLDVVILHHVQEFVVDPHQMLREIQRVIVPHGHLIVFGFNPWSALGVYSQIARGFPDSMWHNHRISCRRMKDWLGLLGFKTAQIQYGFHHPQILERSDRPIIKHCLKNWPFGNFYLVSAIKQVTSITPVRPKWKNNKKRFVSLAPIKPRVSNGRVRPCPLVPCNYRAYQRGDVA